MDGYGQWALAELPSLLRHNEKHMYIGISAPRISRRTVHINMTKLCGKQHTPRNNLQSSVNRNCTQYNCPTILCKSPPTPVPNPRALGYP